MTNACCKLTWIRYLLESLGIEHLETIMLYCNNNATLHIAVNQVYHMYTKYIKLDYHLIRENIQNGSVITKHVSSNQQFVNIFTNTLSNWLLKQHMIKLTEENNYSPSWGRMLLGPRPNICRPVGRNPTAQVVSQKLGYTQHQNTSFH